MKNLKNIPTPKMNHHQAKLLWNTLTPQQKFQFSELFVRLQSGDLMLSEINVDDQEKIQNVVFELKEKPSIPVEPFAKHFK